MILKKMFNCFFLLPDVQSSVHSRTVDCNVNLELDFLLRVQLNYTEFKVPLDTIHTPSPSFAIFQHL